MKIRLSLFRCSARSQCGGYLLELSLVLTGVVVFIVAAADISRVLQARSALRAGVREGLRCMYAADGRCVADAPINGYRERFDVYATGTAWSIPAYRIRTFANWYLLPNITVTPQSRNLQSITFETPMSRYVEHEAQFTVIGHSTFLRLVRGLPRLTGNDPLNPRFVDPATASTARAIVIRPSVSGARRNTFGYVHGGASSANVDNNFKEEMRIGSAEFTVPADGVVSNLRDLLHHTATKGSAIRCVGCENERVRINGETGRVSLPFYLRVSGAVDPSDGERGTDNGAEGAVYMQVKIDGSVTRLGGRRISGTSPGTFVTRNVPKEKISSDLRAAYSPSYEQELELYDKLLFASPGSKIEVEFFLRALPLKDSAESSGRVFWRASRIELYFPELEWVHSRFECGISPEPCNCAAAPSTEIIDYTTVDESRSVLVPASGGLCSATIPEGAVDRVSAELLVSTHAANGSCGGLNVVTESTQPSGCPVTTQVFSCPAAVEHRTFLGCDLAPLDVPTAEAASQCNVPQRVREHGQFVTATYSPLVTHPSTMARAWGDDAAPECATRTQASNPPYAVWEDPTSEDVAACQYEVAPEPPPGIVITDVPNSAACSPLDGRIAAAKERYRREYRVPAGVSIAAAAYRSGETQQVFEPPSGTCSDAKENQIVTPTLVGSGLTRFEVNQICRSGNVTCDIRPRRIPHVVGGVSSSSDVEQVVRESISTMYPRARWAPVCEPSSTDCLDLSVRDATAEDFDGNVSIAASIPVRLLVTSLAKRGPVVLSYAESARTERTLVRSNSR